MLDNVGLRYPHRASGAKAPRTLRPLPLLRFAVSATGGAHLCSIQYYLRFWLSSCRTSLAVSALRIMRYCLRPSQYTISTASDLQGTMLASSRTPRHVQVLSVRQKQTRPCRYTAGADFRQYRTIPALRLKHRSGGCGTASALPKYSIIHKVLSALLA